MCVNVFSCFYLLRHAGCKQFFNIQFTFVVTLKCKGYFDFINLSTALAFFEISVLIDPGNTFKIVSTTMPMLFSGKMIASFLVSFFRFSLCFITHIPSSSTCFVLGIGLFLKSQMTFFRSFFKNKNSVAVIKPRIAQSMSVSLPFFAVILNSFFVTDIFTHSLSKYTIFVFFSATSLLRTFIVRSGRALDIDAWLGC